jgi:hypothetical protein
VGERMVITELKDIADALKKFASIRDKVDGVDSRIGVQAGNGVLKLISGDGTNGIIIDVMQLPSEIRAAFYIAARPFLQGVKALPAKAEVDIDISKNGLTLVSDKGGRLNMPAKGPLSVAGFAKPPKDGILAAVTIDQKTADQISKLYPAVVSGDEKLTQTYGSIAIVAETAYITFVEPRIKTKYASLSLPCFTEKETEIVASATFWEALGASGGGDLIIREGGITVGDDKRTLYATNTTEESWPVFGIEGELSAFNCERKVLIDVIKGQMPNEKFGRVVLSYKDNTLEVRPLGMEGGQTIPVNTSGDAIRGMDGHIFLSMLNALTDKMVTVGIVAGSPAVILRSESYKDWKLMVAPLTTAA